MDLFKDSFKNICEIVKESLENNKKNYFNTYDENAKIGEILYDILEMLNYETTKDELKEKIFLGKYNIITTNHNLSTLYDKYFNKINKLKFDLNFTNLYDFLIIEKSILSFKNILLLETIEKDDLKSNISSFLKMFKNGFKINIKNFKTPLLYTTLLDILTNKQFFESIKNSLIVDLIVDVTDIKKIKIQHILNKLKWLCETDNIYKVFAFICGIEIKPIIYVFDKLNIYSVGKDIISGVFANSKFLEKIKNDILSKKGSDKKLSLIKIIDTNELEDKITLFDLKLDKPYDMYYVKKMHLSLTYSHIQNRLKALLAIVSNTIFVVLDKNDGKGINIIKNILEKLKLTDKFYSNFNNGIIATTSVKNFNINELSHIFNYLKIEIDENDLYKLHIFIKEKLNPVIKNIIEDTKENNLNVGPFELIIEFFNNLNIKIQDLTETVTKILNYVEISYGLKINCSFKQDLVNCILFIIDQFKSCNVDDIDGSINEFKNGLDYAQKITDTINKKTSYQYKFLDIILKHLSTLHIKINNIQQKIRLIK